MYSLSYVRHLYSGDLKTDPSKTGNIRKPDFLKVGIQMVGTLLIYSGGSNTEQVRYSDGP